MTDDARQPGAQATAVAPTAKTCQSIDWFAEGQSRTVEVAGVRVTVRFIGRKGRRGRIAIEAPAGAVFRDHSVGNGSPTGGRQYQLGNDLAE